MISISPDARSVGITLVEEEPWRPGLVDDSKGTYKSFSRISISDTSVSFFLVTCLCGFPPATLNRFPFLLTTAYSGIWLVAMEDDSVLISPFLALASCVFKVGTSSTK
ncbi:hypothetical protein SNE40_017629 [Patella caerulea]|uniref:Uncharacterized protein n=1 Tax=Patella caerulea TaxID=87958 RepID=A0AAN8PA18_PATCE